MVSAGCRVGAGRPCAGIGRERRAERAAGVAGRRLDPDPSNLPSRSTLPFATQLSATPPARQRFSAPVSAASERVSRSTTSSVTAWIDAARSISRWVSNSSGLRGGPPNSSSNSPLVMRRPVQ